MAFLDSKLGHIGENACLVAASVAATLLLIEVGLRLTPLPLLASRYVYWRQATYEGFYYHNATSQPAEQPSDSFHPVRGWTNFSIRRGPDGYLIDDLSGPRGEKRSVSLTQRPEGALS